MIVIGYDGSDGAREAVAAAPALLRQGAALVVHVFPQAERMASTMGVDVRLPEEAVRSARERAEQIAREGAELARRGGLDAKAEAVVAGRRVPEALLRVARERDAEAIIVGSRGLGGVKSALLGSVSSGLLYAADRPVVVVPHSHSA